MILRKCADPNQPPPILWKALLERQESSAVHHLHEFLVDREINASPVALLETNIATVYGALTSPSAG